MAIIKTQNLIGLSVRRLSLAGIVLVAGATQSFAQSIFTNPITGTNPNTADPYTTGQTVAANMTASGIGRGAGITGAAANNRYNASSWNTASLDTTAFFTFTLTPNPTYKLSLTSFVYTGQASGTGPTTFEFRSSADGFAAGIGAPTAGGTTISLAAPAYQGLTTGIEFRLYGYNASASAGTFSVNDFTFNGSVDLPEPSSLALIGLGLAGVAATIRRRKAN